MRARQRGAAIKPASAFAKNFSKERASSFAVQSCWRAMSWWSVGGPGGFWEGSGGVEFSPSGSCPSGIGPLSALAVEAFAPPIECFKRGRDFAAWLGLVPRQYSSGGKEHLGKISKAGQADIRRLLIMGAMSRLNWLGRKSVPEGSWLARMLQRKPRMLVAVALANKMARAIWAMLSNGVDYQYPTQTAAA